MADKVDAAEICILFQGPRLDEAADDAPNGITKACIARARKLFPAAEIVFSTWRGTAVADLTVDKVVFSEDPGGHPFNHNDAFLLNNTNRMLRTVKAGLTTSKEYVLKLRSDLYLYDKNFLRYFDRYDKFYIPLRVFRKKVLLFSLWTRAFHLTDSGRQPCAFHVSDWAQFGLTEDVKLLWDVPEVQEPEFSQWFATRNRFTREIEPWRTWKYPPEQLLGVKAFERLGLPVIDHSSDTSFSAEIVSRWFFATNFVVLDQLKWRMVSLRIPFVQPFLPFQIYRGLYTFEIWLRDYSSVTAGVFPSGKRGDFRHNPLDPVRMCRRLGTVFGLNEVSGSRAFRRILRSVAK